MKKDHFRLTCVAQKRLCLSSLMLRSATERSTWRRTCLLKSSVIRYWLQFGWVNLATKGDELYSQDLPIYNTQISLHQRWGKKPPPNRLIQLHKANNESTVRRQGRWWKITRIHFEPSDVHCLIVSSLKRRAHGKARLRTMTLGTP